MAAKKQRLAAADLTSASLEAELSRVRHARGFRRSLGVTVGALAVVSALCILLATMFVPVLQIYGSSMTPTLEDGDIVVAVSTDNLETGDIVAFYYNNKVLVKRVIAQAGDWVDIKDDGAVYVNGARIDEPYVEDLALGSANIDFPYQVPESRVFVLGDHRSVSIDSRNSAVGCIGSDQVVGKLLLRIWPLDSAGVL